MKNIFTILTVVLLIITGSASGQKFRLAVSESYPVFSDIYMLNETTGWVVGLAGTIYKTTDAGNSWNPISTGISDTLTSVYFLNENVGFVGAKNCKVLKTTNGGLAWQSLTVPAGFTGAVNSLYFANEQRGWALNTNNTTSRVVFTSDGGQNWTAVITNSGNLYDMSFAEPDKGVVVGGGSGKIDLYYTTDGATWKKAAAPSLGGVTYTRTDIRGVSMLNKDFVYATGWGSFAAGLQPSIMFKSTDGGATWTYMLQTEANRTYDNMYSVKFKDAQNGLVFGGSSRGAVVCKTVDGGVNWVQQLVPFGGGIKKAVGFGDKLWLLGDNGMMIKTTDFGATWKIVSNMHNGTYNAIRCFGDKTIYAAGNSAVFAKSTDGGINWKGSFVVPGKVGSNVQNIFFADQNTGYAAQANALVSKTTDGGNSWTQLIPDSLSSLATNHDVLFISDKVGFVVGQAGTNVDKILKTTDGGLSWSAQLSQVSRTLRSIAFADANTGVTVGGVLKVLVTKDAGNTWTPAKFTGLTDSTVTDLRKVGFFNSTTGVAVGDKKIFKTTDAGSTWYPVTPSNLIVTLTDLHIANDGKSAWAIGYRVASSVYTNYIYGTTDAGSTWSLAVDTTALTTTGSLSSITKDKAGNFWVGGSGEIYTNAPLVSVRETGANVPGNYSLSQNFPNPFNPSTTISFNVGAAGKVSLKVYDILGRETASLIDKEMQAGSYSVDFNAGLSSGVYFYTLKAGNFSSTKKMVILK